MAIENWSEDGIVVELTPEPEMAGELKGVTEEVRKRSGCDVVVDFSKADIVNSSSLAELLRLHKLLVAYGRRLVLCSVGPMTRRIFTVTALDQIFEFADDRSAFVPRP
jgi:anti-anti-sigma factor